MTTMFGLPIKPGEFDAAVQSSAFCGVIACDRLSRPDARRFQSRSINAALNQRLLDRVGPVHRQHFIMCDVARGIGVTSYSQPPFREAFQRRRNIVEKRFAVGLDGGLVEIEMDTEKVIMLLGRERLLHSLFAVAWRRLRRRRGNKTEMARNSPPPRALQVRLMLIVMMKLHSIMLVSIQGRAESLA